MDVPTIFPNIVNLESERRITTIMKKYWNFLRKERSFPAEREINPKDISQIWDNCFIVQADNFCRKEDYKYKYLGQNIVRACGSDLTGLNVSNIATTEASRLADKYEQVLASKMPVIDEGEIKISGKEIIKYRQILLPVGDGGVNITAIFGGMSYKIVRLSRTSVFLRFFMKNNA